MRFPFTLLSALITAVSTVRGQAPAVAGTVVNGKVVVRVFVTLSDSVTPYYPVANLPLRFYRSGKDSATAITDVSGATSIVLSPGDYRLLSAKPVTWRGYVYSWNVPIVVRPGMPMIDLRPPDSDVAAVTRVNADPQRSERGSVVDTVFRGYTQSLVPPKDAGTAFLLSFLITGAGQMYAGETGRGITMLLMSAVGAGVYLNALTTQVNCASYSYSSCDSSTGGLALAGVGLWVGTWIYSMADAGPAVRRYNASRGLTAVARQGPHGTTQLGLSIALR
jgi:hypothetical protein